MPCGRSPKSGPDFDPDFEGPSCEDLERFGSDAAACPECGADVYHDAAVCSSCGCAIVGARSGARMSRPVIGVIALVALAAFVFAFLI